MHSTGGGADATGRGLTPPEEEKVYLFGLKGDASVYFARNISALRQTLQVVTKIPAAPEAIAFYFSGVIADSGRENRIKKKIMDAFTARKRNQWGVAFRLQRWQGNFI